MAFNEAYDTLRSRTEEYFSTVLAGENRRLEMNDPYSPEEGREDDLESSWGYKIGSEETNEVFIGSVVIPKGYTRSMELLLSNEYVNTRGEADERTVIEKKLITDGKNLVKYLQNELIACSQIDSVTLLGDNGIEFIFNDRFISMNFNLTITYQE
jgi:hypothetical protein